MVAHPVNPSLTSRRAEQREIPCLFTVVIPARPGLDPGAGTHETPDRVRGDKQKNQLAGQPPRESIAVSISDMRRMVSDRAATIFL